MTDHTKEATIVNYKDDYSHQNPCEPPSHQDVLMTYHT